MGPEFRAEDLLRIALMLPLFLFSLTIHEFAHAWAAKKFGDPTAEQAGRLTLDPRVHIDPVGLLVFLLSAVIGFGFGWARPVPVRLGNCRNPLQAMFWIAAAGPLSNLLQALASVFLLLFLGLLGAVVREAPLLGIQPIFTTPGLGWLDMFACLLGYFIQINFLLMLFNLLPIPPLDGGRILVSVLPHRYAGLLAGLERYGFLILLLGFRFVGVLIGAPLTWLLVGLSALLGSLGLR